MGPAGPGGASLRALSSCPSEGTTPGSRKGTFDSGLTSVTRGNGSDGSMTQSKPLKRHLTFVEIEETQSFALHSISGGQTSLQLPATISLPRGGC